MAFGLSILPPVRCLFASHRSLICRLPHRKQNACKGRTIITHASTKVPSDATERLITYCANGGVERDIAKRVIDSAQRAVHEWSTFGTEFLTPPESVTLQRAVESLGDVRVLAWGGYEDAERRALFISHEDVVPTANVLLQLAKEHMVLLKIFGSFENEKGKR